MLDDQRALDAGDTPHANPEVCHGCEHTDFQLNAAGRSEPAMLDKTRQPSEIEPI
jgi:hypothetical protein